VLVVTRSAGEPGWTVLHCSHCESDVAAVHATAAAGLLPLSDLVAYRGTLWVHQNCLVRPLLPPSPALLAHPTVCAGTAGAHSGGMGTGVQKESDVDAVRASAAYSSLFRIVVVAAAAPIAAPPDAGGAGCAGGGDW
jgi:hypothetical protein